MHFHQRAGQGTEVNVTLARVIELSVVDPLEFIIFLATDRWYLLWALSVEWLHCYLDIMPKDANKWNFDYRLPFKAHTQACDNDLI